MAALPIVLMRVLGRGGSCFADQTTDFVESGVLELFAVERRAAGEQLVEQHAQRIDVAAGVDVQAAAFGLLGTHVERRADHLAVAGGQGLAGQLLVDRLGDPEVDDLGDRARRRAASREYWTA